MSTFKKGQAVKACTIKNREAVAGKITEIVQTTKGDWITVKPSDPKLREFKTRPALVQAA